MLRRAPCRLRCEHLRPSHTISKQCHIPQRCVCVVAALPKEKSSSQSPEPERRRNRDRTGSRHHVCVDAASQSRGGRREGGSPHQQAEATAILGVGVAGASVKMSRGRVTRQSCKHVALTVKCLKVSSMCHLSCIAKMLGLRQLLCGSLALTSDLGEMTINCRTGLQL